MNSFKKTYKYVSEIRPYSYQKNEKKLREIVTETIIPSPVYEEKSTQILEGVQKLKQADLSVIQRQKLRNQIWSIPLTFHIIIGKVIRML